MTLNAGYLLADNAEPHQHPLALHPQAVLPPMTRWLLANFEDTPATYTFLEDCTTLDRHRAVKAIMVKTLYGTMAILPSAVAHITRADMLQYLTIAQLVFTVGSTGRALLGRLLGPLFGRVSPTLVLPWPTTASHMLHIILEEGITKLKLLNTFINND